MSSKNTGKKEEFDIATITPKEWWREYEGIAAGAAVLESKVRTAHNAYLKRSQGAACTEEDLAGAIHYKRVEMLSAQAIECALKAVLAAKGRQIPTSHDLRFLIGRAEIKHLSDRELRYLDVLSRMNHLGRYPVTMKGWKFSSWDPHKAPLRNAIMASITREFDDAVRDWVSPN